MWRGERVVRLRLFGVLSVYIVMRLKKMIGGMVCGDNGQLTDKRTTAKAPIHCWNQGLAASHGQLTDKRTTAKALLGCQRMRAIAICGDESPHYGQRTDNGQTDDGISETANTERQ